MDTKEDGEMTIGEKIKKLRKEAEMTQAEHKQAGS